MLVITIDGRAIRLFGSSHCFSAEAAVEATAFMLMYNTLLRYSGYGMATLLFLFFLEPVA